MFNNLYDVSIFQNTSHGVVMWNQDIKNIGLALKSSFSSMSLFGIDIESISSFKTHGYDLSRDFLGKIGLRSLVKNTLVRWLWTELILRTPICSAACTVQVQIQAANWLITNSWWFSSKFILWFEPPNGFFKKVETYRRWPHFDGILDF